MKIVYTDENPVLVWNAKNLVENAGIACMVRNEFASGGVGDLSFLDTRPELWVMDDRDYDAAAALLDDIFDRDRPEGKSWLCPGCGENNGPAFEICWNCAKTQPPGRA